MLNFIKKNLFIILIFFVTLLLGFLTFLTFLDKSFIKLNDQNLQYLLVSNIALLIIFFLFIFFEVKNSIKSEIVVAGSKANRKYIVFFSLFTLIPSLLISIFSLFIFSFALEKYFDKKITTAVNNSYEIAKNYVDNVRNKIEADTVLISLDLNKNVNIFYDNPTRFKNLLITQKYIRDVDEIYLINSSGKLIISSNTKDQKFVPPNDKALEMVYNDERPLKIINAPENKTAAIQKLTSYIDTYVYVIKFLDVKISNYLTESEEAINFYYRVEDKRTGIKISFILIYIVIVSLLLFLSISIAIRFSSRFFRSISNLIFASHKIGEGNLETKVPEIKTDKELEILNKNFNFMIDQLREQQEKLILQERHEAWSTIARKLAHEIKNPLTPIQLTIDRLKNKYSNIINSDEKNNFNKHLKTIHKQITQIESLVNEFSDFARMPKPLFRENDLFDLINSNIILLQELDKSIKINIISNKNLKIICDYEQISRVILNLIKNSIESIKEKAQKTEFFDKKIDIEILKRSDYIEIEISDNGVGFRNQKIKELIRPYYTTKQKGSGLGLSIVNKIINDHNGSINFNSTEIGAKVKIILPIK